jgi:hypothetical protein
VYADYVSTGRKVFTYWIRVGSSPLCPSTKTSLWLLMTDQGRESRIL